MYEPMLGLDHNSKELFFNYIKTIREEYNPTIIISTHDLSILSVKGAQIYEIKQKTIKHKSLEELLKNESNNYSIPKKYLFKNRLEKVLQTISIDQAKIFRKKFELLIAEMEDAK